MVGFLVFAPLRPVTAWVQSMFVLGVIAAHFGQGLSDLLDSLPASALFWSAGGVFGIGAAASIAERLANELVVFPWVKKRFVKDKEC